MDNSMEQERLLEGWDSGTFDSAEKSAEHHFAGHGAAVGAVDVWQYLRKAEAFAQNLRGSQKSQLGGGKTRYTKSGKYIILTAGGKAVSFGKSRD